MRTAPKLFPALALVACANPPAPAPQVEPDARPAASQPASVASTSTVVEVSQAKWEHLNPARGDKAPQAATLWGDRNGTVATGYLLKPRDGFRSPPHVHNVSYRGVVIRGLLHNDDPDAEERWLPTGSYWTQPKGDVHITAAQGDDILAYIEIDEGPYLVLPVEQAFATDEQPRWVDASEVAWGPAPADGVQIAPLWGDAQDDQPRGALVKLPGGFTGQVGNSGSALRVVVIDGEARYQGPGQPTEVVLEPGSYFGSTEASEHRLSTGPGDGCVLYVRVSGPLQLTAQAG